VVALSLTWGEVSVKAFLVACLAAIVLAAISWVVLNSMQEPADRAFATSPYTRGPSCPSAIRPIAAALWHYRFVRGRWRNALARMNGLANTWRAETRLRHYEQTADDNTAQWNLSANH
jgi:hypothetical protein